MSDKCPRCDAVLVVCPKCKGEGGYEYCEPPLEEGADGTMEWQECFHCHGTGLVCAVLVVCDAHGCHKGKIVVHYYSRGEKAYEKIEDCPACKGKGVVCAGEGEDDMDDKQKLAYDWALNQQYQSVAARHARTLAEYIAQLRAEVKRLRGLLKEFRIGIRDVLLASMNDECAKGYQQWLKKVDAALEEQP